MFIHSEILSRLTLEAQDRNRQNHWGRQVKRSEWVTHLFIERLSAEDYLAKKKIELLSKKLISDKNKKIIVFFNLTPERIWLN